MPPKPAGLSKFFHWDYYVGILSGEEKYRSVAVILLFSIVLSIYYSYKVLKVGLPFANNFSYRVEKIVDEVIPEDLTVTIKNGRVTTNVTEPYYVTIRKENVENLFGFANIDTKSVSKIRILTIDTKGRAEDFEQYQSLALLTETSLVYYDDEKINIYSLRDMEDFTFNKKMVEKLLAEINPDNTIGNLILIFLYISPLFIFLGIFIFQFLSFILLTISVYIMARIYQTGAKFWNVYRYTVAITIVPIIIWSIILFFPYAVTYLSGLDSLHTMFIYGLAFLGIKRFTRKNVPMNNVPMKQ